MMKRAFHLKRGHFTSGVEWPFFFGQGEQPGHFTSEVE